MKAIYIDKFVGVSGTLKGKINLLILPQNYDEINVSEIPKPQPKDGEVLVQISAAGVNFVDLLYVSTQTSITNYSPTLETSNLIPLTGKRQTSKQPLPRDTPLHPRPRIRRDRHLLPHGNITNLQARRPRIRRPSRQLRRIHIRPRLPPPSYPLTLGLRLSSRPSGHSSS